MDKNKSGYFEREVLESAWDKGFEVEYMVDNEECLKCLGSDEGDCGWNNNSDIEKHVKSTCYYDKCSDGSIAYSSYCSPLHKSMFSIFCLIKNKVSFCDSGRACVAIFVTAENHSQM
jgi:hypothetical protein